MRILGNTAYGGIGHQQLYIVAGNAHLITGGAAIKSKRKGVGLYLCFGCNQVQIVQCARKVGYGLPLVRQSAPSYSFACKRYFGFTGFNVGTQVHYRESIQAQYVAGFIVA